MSEGLVQVSVRLPDPLLKTIKIQAIKDELSLQDFMAEALYAYLQSRSIPILAPVDLAPALILGKEDI
jgi:hypothetical protein